MRLSYLLCALPLLTVFVGTAQAQARPTVSVAVDPTTKGNMIVSGTAPGTGDLMICLLLTASYGSDGSKCLKSTTLKDKAYSDSIPTEKWKYVTVYQGTSFAVRTIAVPSTTTVAAASSTLKNDIPILVDQYYCDTSLPYLYQSTATLLNMQLGAKPGWADDLNTRVANADKAVPPTIKGSAAIKNPISVIRSDEKSLNLPLPSSDPDGALVKMKGDPNPDTLTLYDDGEPLLSAALPTATTMRAQRLLVRTLISPNASSVACAYQYLSAKNPPPQDNGKPALLKDANGNANDPIGKGALYHFSLNAPDAPQYYLINIVRWKDTPKPSTVADTDTIPFFTVDSDDWYLLNYSDNSDNIQDITKFKPWHHFTPSLVTGDTLRMMGSKRVAFLGIHLAPPSAVDDASRPLFGDIAPTEQAWYDNIKLKYTIHADSVQSIQMQDLSTLLTILATNAGVPLPKKQEIDQPKANNSDSQAGNTANSVEDLKTTTTGLSETVVATRSEIVTRTRSLSQMTPAERAAAQAELAAAQKDAATLTATLTSLSTEVTSVNAQLAKITQTALTLLDLSLPTAAQTYGCTPPATAPLLSFDTTSPHPSVQVDATVISCLNSLAKAKDLDDAALKLANTDVQKDIANLKAIDKALTAQAALATILSGIDKETKADNTMLGAENMSALGVVLHGAQLPVLAQDYGCKIDPPKPLLSMDMPTDQPSIKADGAIEKPSTDADGNIKKPSINTDTTIQTCLYALVKSRTPDTAKIALATAATQKDLDNLKAVETALGKNAVTSLYQGLYGAGVLTGMASLPSSSIASPVDITGTWTATFAVSPKPKSGGSGAPAPVTGAPAPQTPPTPQLVPQAPAQDPSAGRPQVAPKPGASAPKPATPPAHNSGTAHKPPSSNPPASHGPSASPESDWLPDTPLLTGAAGVPEPQTTTPPSNPAPTGQKGSTGSTGSTGSAAAPAGQDASANPPCVVAATADNLGQAPCSHPGTKVHDEGRSWFDISVGVSLTGYKDLTTTTQTSGTGMMLASTTTVTRENAYGLLDIFYIPEDLVDPPKIGIPHIVVGLPFAGQVFNKPYFAIGETFNFPKLLNTSSNSKFPLFNSLLSSLPFKARPVFGWVYNKESTTSGTTKIKYRSLVPQWAIELSFRDVQNAVTTLAKGSSSGKAKQ